MESLSCTPLSISSSLSLCLAESFIAINSFFCASEINRLAQHSTRIASQLSAAWRRGIHLRNIWLDHGHELTAWFCNNNIQSAYSRPWRIMLKKIGRFCLKSSEIGKTIQNLWQALHLALNSAPFLYPHTKHA